MAFLNRCRFLTSTTGNGTSIVAGAAVAGGWFAPTAAGAVDGASYRYLLENPSSGDSEINYGPWSASGGTLGRGTPEQSTNSGNRIALTSGAIVSLLPSALDLNGVALLSGAAFTGPLTVPGLTATGASIGYSSMQSGGATRTGYFAGYAAAGNRYFAIGYVDTSSGGSAYLDYTNDSGYPHRFNSALAFMTDNANDLFSGAYRARNIYYGGSLISGSSEKLKDLIDDTPDAWLDAWGDIRWRWFKMRDAMALKGAAARRHFGIIVEEALAAFTARGLDLTDSAIACLVNIPAVAAQAAVAEERDNDGNTTVVAQDAIAARDADEVWNAAYIEALCLEAAWGRRELSRKETRLAALEAAVSALQKAA